jgi:predicted nucleic acid-binding Zn ribbon protein
MVITDRPDPEEEPTTDLAADLLARVSAGAGGTRSTTPTNSRRRRWARESEPVFSGAGPDVRDPMALSRAVAEVMADQGWRERTRMAAALARWEDIAGPDLAAHVVAESFTDGVLTLRADSTAWATQLRLLLPTVRTRVDAAVGQGVVTNIVVRGPDVNPRQRGAWRVAGGRGPRDTYG